jgi:carotenoid cleavage dioxygenase-like enzyme
VATEKYLREESAQAFLYNATGTPIPNARVPRNNDSVNVANTALLPWQDELLALWEGGSAYSLNPETLTTLGEKIWSDELAHVPFSAHPLLEKDGSLWNFGFVPYSKEARLLIYHISPKSKVIGFSNIVLPQRGYLHAFAQTKDYLIFYVSACIYEQGETFLSAFHWRPEVGSKILVINKNSLDKPRWFDVPAEFVFHFGNAWQDNNSINVVMARYKNADLMLNGMHKVMIGEQPEIEHAQMTIANINLQTGKVTLNASGINLEFPNYNPNTAGPTTIYGTHAALPGRKFLADSIAAMHPEKGLLDHYYFGKNVIAEEPLLIITSKNNYLITSYYNYDKQHSGIALFHANKLNDGPIAQAKMDYVLPLGFHGCFVPTNA